jgi:cellulose biosynthesis protein BcsQ
MKPGQVISFYSFKGGVGRTMALANAACLLASPRFADPSSKRKRVLMIDWDLDSPGLHYYFYKEGLPQSTFGLVQLLLDLDLSGVVGAATGSRYRYEVLERRLESQTWSDYYHKVPNLAEDLDLYFMPHSGGPAGEYFNDLIRIDWAKIDEDAPFALTQIVRHLAREFDYVLIDSRTGLSLSALMCAMIPDKMVYVFNFNKQSLYGSRSFFRKVIPDRQLASKVDPTAKPLHVFPLGSMIQEGIPRDFEDWIHNEIHGAKYYLAELFPTGRPAPREFWENYIREHYIPYMAQLAYGEQVLSKNPALVSEHSVAKRYQGFVESLISNDTPWGETVARPTAQIVELKTRPDTSVQTLVEAARQLEWWVNSGDVYEKLAPKVGDMIRSFAGALAYDSLGPRLITIGRHYVATADAAQNFNDRWATIWWEYARETLQKTENDLEKLKNRELPDGFSSMDGAFWSTELWIRASNYIWTTNVAGVGQSFGRRLDLPAITRQGETVKRGVPVTRVFVLEDYEEDESRITLQNIIEAQFKAGISVHVIQRWKFDEIKSDVEDTLGSDDFMIVDDQFIYVTERKKIDSTAGVSAAKRIRILNAGDKLRYAKALRFQIQGAATQVTSAEQIPKIVPAIQSKRSVS